MEGTIPIIFQSWFGELTMVSGLAGPNEGLCALTLLLTACSGSPTGITALSAAEIKIQWSINLTANSLRYLHWRNTYLASWLGCNWRLCTLYLILKWPVCANAVRYPGVLGWNWIRTHSTVGVLISGFLFFTWSKLPDTDCKREDKDNYHDVVHWLKLDIL